MSNTELLKKEMDNIMTSERTERRLLKEMKISDFVYKIVDKSLKESERIKKLFSFISLRIHEDVLEKIDNVLREMDYDDRKEFYHIQDSLLQMRSEFAGVENG